MSSDERVSRPLVIGYGNTLRRDDAVGVRVAELLAADGRVVGVDVLAVHQLTPELAIDVGGASFVVFVDADPSVAPGAMEVRRLSLDAGPAAGATTEPGASSHHVGILELLGLARELTGRAPEAVAVAVGVADLELGEGLTPAVEAALPGIVERVRGLLAG
jgi:hydrogenase maturation protease